MVLIVLLSTAKEARHSAGRKVPGVLLDKLNVRQRCALGAKMSNGLLGCIRQFLAG